MEQLDSLHVSHYESECRLKAFEETVLQPQGKELDIKLDICLTDARAVTLSVLRSPDGKEHTDITVYRSRMKRLDHIACEYSVAVDTTHASSTPDAEGRQPEVMKLPDVKDGHIRLRVLVDRCMVEVFVNGRITMMQMMYPSEDSRQISLTALGGPVHIPSVQVWNMASIYE